jgi:1,2-diacylglycerol 3-alpha-glucosyltransferase
VSRRISATVLFVNYGAYHRARAAALSQISDLSVHFIELAAEQGRYPWHASPSTPSPELITLGQGRYEDLSTVELGYKLWGLLEKLQPDVVVPCGYNEPPMLAALMWAKARRRPCVLMFETTAIDRPRPWWQEIPKSAFLRVCVDAVFCGGAAHRSYLRRLGVADERIRDHYDVVDVSYFGQAAQCARPDSIRLRQELRLPNDYWLYVGRFSPEKNLARLLRAYRRYSELSANPWGLVLVGQGAEEPELRGLSRRLGLAGVTWAGPQPLEKLPAYYGLARGLVLPSLVEPWGLVVNEAMACGLPVLVSSRCGCVPDLVQPGVTGYTFDPLCVDDIARCMNGFAALDPDTRAMLGSNAVHAISQYTPEIWAENLAASIESVAVGQASVQ